MISMKIINAQEMSKEKIFHCFSPPLKNFLVDVKGILFVDEFFNKKTKKSCWIFIRGAELNLALIEWTERGKNNNKFY
jgi:hypothetical protein